MHEKFLSRIAHGRPLRLGVDHNAICHIEISRSIHENMAVASARLDNAKSLRVRPDKLGNLDQLPINESVSVQLVPFQV